MSEITLISQWNSRSFMDSNEGITKNLSSLSFDAVVEEPEKRMLYLRKRSYMQTMNIISHAVYFTTITDEIKKRACAKSSSGRTEELRPLKIGIIGLGRLGLHLVNALIEHCKVLPKDIKVSTRRPGAILDDITAKGIDCFYDNAKAVRNVDIVFLCCLPQQADRVLHEIKGHVKCLVYSIIAGLTTSKISEVIEFKQVFKPCYDHYRKEEYNGDWDWDSKISICEALALSHIKELTCPLIINTNNNTSNENENIVQISDSIIHCLFVHGLNVCLDYCLTLEESVAICNKIVFRDMIGFTFDSIKKLTASKMYESERFQLNEYAWKVKVLMNMTSSRDFCDNFIRHYKSLFDRFSDWTTF